jgi:hypothetical protein
MFVSRKARAIRTDGDRRHRTGGFACRPSARLTAEANARDLARQRVLLAGSRLAGRQQTDTETRHDHVLHELEAVGAVDDAWLEPGEGSNRADDLLVRAVAGVHDPVVILEARECFQSDPLVTFKSARHAECPLRAAQWLRDNGPVEHRRREVVVIGQCEVDVIRGQQVECLVRLVLVDAQLHPGVLLRKRPHHRKQRLAHGRGERRYAKRPCRGGGRVEVRPRRFEGGQDGHRMVRQAPARRCEPHPAPLVLEQRGPGFPRKGGDLLGDGGGRDVHDLRDLSHRAEA